MKTNTHAHGQSHSIQVGAISFGPFLCKAHQASRRYQQFKDDNCTLYTHTCKAMPKKGFCSEQLRQKINACLKVEKNIFTKHLLILF